MTASIESDPIADAKQQQQRAGFVKGLRAYADALEANPESLPLPYQGIATEIVTYFFGDDDPRSALAAAARALPCDFRKSVTEPGERFGAPGTFRLTGKLHGLGIELTAYRDAVCERVVTGTAEVTKLVKDPEALAAVPEVEVTETVETVEWICGPVMAPAKTASAA